MRQRTGLLTVLATSVLLITGCSGSATAPDRATVDPLTWRADLWQELLGGEGTNPLDDQRTLARLNDPSSSDLGAERAGSARDAARAWLTAEVTGTGRDAFAGYWPDGDGTVNGALAAGAGCTNLRILAVNPQPLPLTSAGSQEWVKVLLGWTANCPAADRTRPQVTFAYLRADADSWAVVRPARVPTVEPETVSGVVPEWALTELVDCTEPGVRARLEIAEAWKVLCADATREKVTLTARIGWRSPEEQAELFDEAVALYGAEEARRRIAAADANGCSSAHCAGTAIDIVPDDTTLAWLRTTVLCTDLAGTFTPATQGQCAPGWHPVPRMTRYGFTSPVPRSPGHLEWSLPLPSLEGPSAGCTADAGVPVGDVIDAIWRCRLLTAGYPADRIPAVLPLARALARCESGLDPGFQAFGGRFSDQPHPDTGRPYEALGLFGLTSGWTEALLGPDAPWWEPDLSALAGVERFLDEWTYGRDPWKVFGCVGGDGVRPGGLFATFP